MTRAHERTAPVLRADVLTAPAMFHVERATDSAKGPPAFAHPCDVPMSMSSDRLAVPRGTVRQKNCAHQTAPRTSSSRTTWTATGIVHVRAAPAQRSHAPTHPHSPHGRAELAQHDRALVPCLHVPRGTTEGIAHVQAAPTSCSHAPTPLPPPHGITEAIAHERTELVQHDHVVSPSPVPRETTRGIAHEPATFVQRGHALPPSFFAGHDEGTSNTPHPFVPASPFHVEQQGARA